MQGIILNIMETSNFTYGGFTFVVWTGIFLGVLHTIMPCEDKAVFCFYAFGVSRDWKQAFRILNFYGLGLFLMNLTIGSTLSYFAAIIGPFIREHIDRFVWNAISSFSLIIAGVVMLIQLKKNHYWPHSEQLQELSEGLSTLRARKRTAFLLGLLAGIPPCIFEMAIYFHAMGFAIQYGWGNGVWTVFFFGLGTWVGLFPLAILGSMSGKISKMLQKSSFKRVFSRMRNQNYKNKFSSLKNRRNSKTKKDSIKEKEKITEISKNRRNDTNRELEIDLSKGDVRLLDDDEALDRVSRPLEGEKRVQILGEEEIIEKGEMKTIKGKEEEQGYSKIEFFSGASLIILGIIFFILALLHIDIFVWNEPLVPAPFSFLSNL